MRRFRKLTLPTHREIGKFASEEEAARQVDAARKTAGLEAQNEFLLSNPAERAALRRRIGPAALAEDAAEGATAAPVEVEDAIASAFWGVHSMKSGKRWRGAIRIGTRKHAKWMYVAPLLRCARMPAPNCHIKPPLLHPHRIIGHFDDEANAARAVEAALTERGLPARNAVLLADPVKAAAARAKAVSAMQARRATAAAKAADPRNTTPYIGVQHVHPGKPWRAQVRHDGVVKCVVERRRSRPATSARRLGTSPRTAGAAADTFEST